MRFSLFSEIFFEVYHPDALIEAYCFQNDFYRHYDLVKERTISHVNKIGARIDQTVLETKVMGKIDSIPMFHSSLEKFIKFEDKIRSAWIEDLCHVVDKLLTVDGIGFSKSTKILHTFYPQIIPMIDNPLQQEYQQLKEWKPGNWKQLFMDYYDNFRLVKETYSNLLKLHKHLSHLGLTKVRIFDILWWSYLKAKSLKVEMGINWSTIKFA